MKEHIVNPTDTERLASNAARLDALTNLCKELQAKPVRAFIFAVWEENDDSARFLGGGIFEDLMTLLYNTRDHIIELRDEAEHGA